MCDIRRELRCPVVLQKNARKGEILVKKVNPAKDYAVGAFRYWAAQGCPSYETAAEKIVRLHADPAERERALERAAAKLTDILACEETFRQLEAQGKRVICDAIRAVYMVSPRRNPSRKELTERVVAFARRTYVTDRQVWRYLAEACVEFAGNKGLRVDDDDV